MTRSILYVLLIQFFILIMSNTACGKETDAQTKKALTIVKKNAKLVDSVNQILVVFNDSAQNNDASIVALEKKGKQWTPVTEVMKACIGRKGFAAPGEKREGDNKSPTGFFRLGQLFGYEKDIDTSMPHQQTTAEDKWIDDPESPDYNKYIKGNTSAKSYENLKISSDEYKLCLVIEYNMHPVVKGMGSAIFMHLSFADSPNPSSGCVVLTQQNMEKLLRWMKPEAKPSILMGNEKNLNAGLK